MCSLIGLAINTSAQSPKKLIREGYDLYQQGKYAEAAAKFKEAGVTDPNTYKPFFNQGGAWYEADSLNTAAEQFELAQYRADNKQERAAALHNLGNTYLKKKDYDRAIQYFEQSLLQNPKDEETRYNLAYAMAMRKQHQGQQQQNQQNKKNQDQKNKQGQKNQQQKQDQNKQDQQKQQQQKQQDQRKNQDQQNQDQQQQGKKQEISKQQAEQLLQALEKNEQDIQKKMLKIQAKPEKLDKDW